MKTDYAALYPTELHWEFFLEFARKEMAVGGPDPQLETLGPMTAGFPQEEKVWAMGCFAAGYAVSTAEVIWEHWPLRRVLEEPGFQEWIAANWEGMALRRERRAVRTPAKFSRCLLSFAAWLEGGALHEDWWHKANFSAAYDSISQVWGMGRYINLKTLELLARHCDSVSAQASLMARGGWSPRAGLASLYPEHAEALLGNDSPSHLEQAERQATRLQHACRERQVCMDWFQLQVFLCEYKQALRGKKYPGRSHDSELGYHRATQAYWGNHSGLYAARRELFDERVLGEATGMWAGTRAELERTLLDHGYLWSDLEFDYVGTRHLGEPVRW